MMRGLCVDYVHRPSPVYTKYYSPSISARAPIVIASCLKR